MKTNPTDRYFATAEKQNIGSSLMNRFAEETGLREERGNMYATAHSHYYGHDVGRGVTNAIRRGGEQDELAVIRINKARSIAKSLKSLVTGAPVTWRTQAAANSPGAKAATILSSNLCEWAWKKKNVGQVAATMGEMGIVYSEGFVFHPWDETIGPERQVDPTTKTIVREGDIAYHNLPPWDVMRDGSERNATSGKWKSVRLWLNKWDLLTLRPTDILGQPTREMILSASKSEDAVAISPTWKDKTTDLVPVWFFYHEPTPSLPAGREVILVSANCVLRDVPLRYTSIPLTRYGVDELHGTPFGYSSWWDTLAVQELMDSLESSIATNLLTLGVQSVGIEQGTESPIDNAFGMKEYVYPKGGQPPKGIQLSTSPAEAFGHLKQKTEDQMQLLNLNGVQRGQPGTADMNAQAFMVLSSKAVEQNQPEQKGWLGAVSEIGMKTVETMMRRVTDERKLQIVGRGQKYLLTSQSFKGDDLKSVESVFVEIGNPLEQSAAGRYQLAQVHLEAGLIKTPEDMQQVLDTGRLDPAIQDIRDESMHIAAENEELSQGKVPLCHPFHNSLRHAPKHAALTSNPEIMSNPKALDAIQKHVLEHYSEFFMLPAGADPMADPQYPIRIRMLLGQPPPPDMAPPPMDPNAPPGMAGPPAPGATSGTPPPDMMPPGGPVKGMPAMPQPPQPPPPMTGAPGGPPPI